ncbi:splicing factor 3a subunit 2 [Magnaporthiopsis poae ATCC 64411]|uniref:Splicing factor 3a subunit 2 n=1 Tax=Magnaporthiopsis poae (strain ATCC 64411 / 73-15) TaxID=644358 RepID=A0A0C4DUT6_MAGP6|nr:splicing factor 3a subunit 2 [Magnaporthiopsis poae ATCC 64411]
MDYQNRAGSKFGGGGVASQSATNADRRERLRKLALEHIDLDKDPYIFKNHLGSFECRLCLTTAARNAIKIGRPGYKITKVRDPVTRADGLIFQLQLPEIGRGGGGDAANKAPKWQVVSAFSQRVEEPDRNFQYLLVAAEPYETCGFKIPARELDRREGRTFEYWDPDAKEYWIQVMFMTEREERFNAAPGLIGRR